MSYAKGFQRELGGTGGSDRDGYAGYRIRGRQHVAPAIKDSSRIDHQAGRMDFTGNDSFGLNLDAPLCENHAIEAPGDDNAVAFNLPFDLSTVTQYHGLLGNDVALNTSVDAKRPRYRESPFEVHALINEACPFFARSGFCSRTGPLPRHSIPQRDSIHSIG